jgi:hypothetical protein
MHTPHLYVMENKTLRGLAAYLDEIGVASPAVRGRSKQKSETNKWNVGSLRKILNNKTYRGTWQYGKTKMVNGKQVRRYGPI